MERFKNYKFTWLAFIGILTAVLMPGSDVPSVGIPHIDKLVHFIMFAVITGCYNWEYYRKHLKCPLFLKSSFIFVIYGALTEIAQYFVPGRSCDMTDLLADAVGVFFVGCIAAIYSKRKN